MLDRGTIAAAEVFDCLEVRRQPISQPYPFDVALRLTLQPPAGLDFVQVAVDINPEEHSRAVARSTGGLGDDALEAQVGEIRVVDKDIDHSDRIVLADVVVEARR